MATFRYAYRKVAAVTTHVHARYAAAAGRRARARAVFIVHMHIRADHVTRSIS